MTINDKLTVTRTADLEKRNAIIEEFKTLDDDINTVKKLKVMVEVFQRIKRENPVAYDRMVKFFDENEKAHRIRRELRLLGKKNRVDALEQKLEKCHPKSGKELIQMFVQGLSDLYPDMTKLLLKELEGAVDSKCTRKTPPQRLTKEDNPRITTPKMVSSKSSKGACTKTKTTCSIPTSMKCPHSASAECTKACTTTSAMSCNTANECNANCKEKISDRVCKEEHNDETGDMRIHPTARSCKNTDQLLAKAKTKILQNENLTLTAPFKDFQVQGSIMFSNPSKPIKKSESKGIEHNLMGSTIEKSQLADNWRGWYPRSDSVNVVSSIDGSGLSDDDVIQSGQPVVTVGSGKAYQANSIEKLSEGADLIAQNTRPDSTLNTAMLDSYPTASQHRRNKKRSMYVLYE